MHLCLHPPAPDDRAPADAAIIASVLAAPSAISGRKLGASQSASSWANKGKGNEVTGHDTETYTTLDLRPPPPGTETAGNTRSRHEANFPSPDRISSRCSRAWRRWRARSLEWMRKLSCSSVLCQITPPTLNDCSFAQIRSRLRCTQYAGDRVECMENDITVSKQAGRDEKAMDRRFLEDQADALAGAINRLDEVVDVNKASHVSLSHAVDTLRGQGDILARSNEGDAHTESAWDALMQGDYGRASVAPMTADPLLGGSGGGAEAARQHIHLKSTIGQPTRVNNAPRATRIDRVQQPQWRHTAQQLQSQPGMPAAGAAPRVVAGTVRPRVDSGSSMPSKRMRGGVDGSDGGPQTASPSYGVAPAAGSLALHSNNANANRVRNKGSPLDVWVRLLKVSRDPTEDAKLVLSLVHIQIVNMGTVRAMDDPYVISIRMKNYGVAAALVNAYQPGNVPPRLRGMSAGWVDPRAHDIVGALLPEDDANADNDNAVQLCTSPDSAGRAEPPAASRAALEGGSRQISEHLEAMQQHALPALEDVRILAWNIKGRTRLLLENSIILCQWALYDIIVLQETWLLPGEEDSLPLPEITQSLPAHTHLLRI
ncbi:hypothetical protein BD626DRAFT_571259 [Schizophyllum amplum]|uniref:Uncharacterized protein n=1 Tax=Schizophyllum amplum TaxID=97359 RepID=A0A550C7U3_9AGAR|nr:hypothetical protein BD626DRAFT_571259 [Auriculariopsis ampla]